MHASYLPEPQSKRGDSYINLNMKRCGLFSDSHTPREYRSTEDPRHQGLASYRGGAGGRNRRLTAAFLEEVAPELDLEARG